MAPSKSSVHSISTLKTLNALVQSTHGPIQNQHRYERAVCRSFRRLDPLKSESVPVQLFAIPASSDRFLDDTLMVLKWKAKVHKEMDSIRQSMMQSLDVKIFENPELLTVFDNLQPDAVKKLIDRK
ncbi:unnamed protein product [Adineta ricciae]|uniref:Uncharacterized protein n=1 Tax=Adineta ricciae TaxID=249248 RepID=A0A815WE13_ADIRI|nr:unnamed protein product [Adineta ricciae]CAF1663860.1 unnamed protein product [Adineta ricciae]